MTGQMSERDELARVVYRAWRDGQRGGLTSDAEFDATFSRTEFGWMQAVADAALARFAEHRGPRVVSTVEELDALPVRSVVRDPHGRAFEKFSDGWAATGLAGAHDVCARPATVLLTPTTESEDR